MIKRLHSASFIMFLFAGFLSACSTANSNDAKPTIFEDIHYFATDPDASAAFFRKHFGARLMAHPGRPQDYVGFWALRSGEVPLTVSPIGPYKTTPPGSTFWSNKQIIPPSPDDNSYYGVYAVGVATPSLKEAVGKLTAEGVELSRQHISLPLSLIHI